MCYDVQALTKLREAYAKRRGHDAASIEKIEEELEQYEGLPPIYHASGFTHPELLVFTNEAPYQPQFFTWGLIPFWVKDQKKAAALSKKTLNARGETIFEKPAFRTSAKNKRCLIMIDAFYEHHHFQKNTYPFRIKLKNDEPIVLAGLWEKWVNDGQTKYTFAIVTTKANLTMEKIHNNPKLPEPRMPLILPKELENNWLAPINNKSDQEMIAELIVPYADTELEYHPVGKLRGKEAVGNIPEVLEKVDYEGLPI